MVGHAPFFALRAFYEIELFSVQKRTVRSKGLNFVVFGFDLDNFVYHSKNSINFALDFVRLGRYPAGGVASLVSSVVVVVVGKRSLLKWSTRLLNVERFPYTCLICCLKS